MKIEFKSNYNVITTSPREFVSSHEADFDELVQYIKRYATEEDEVEGELIDFLENYIDLFPPSQDGEDIDDNSDMCTTITNLDEIIAELRHFIAFESCCSQMSAGSRFCSTCGTKLR